MHKTKQWLFGFLALTLVFGIPLTSQAADKPAATAAATAASVKAPIVIEGDELSFNDSTGEVYAKGKVTMTQNNDKVLTDLLQGNTKKNEVWMNDDATLLQPGMTLHGVGTHYNYQQKTGTIKQAKGVIEESGKPYDEHIAGQTIDFSTNQITIHDGMITTCSAKVPDYHVSATRIEMWPGDKYIAYNVKFWIKNKVILSLPKFEQSLEKGKDGESAFPRINYSSSNGLSIAQHVEYPFSDRLSAFANLAYYSKKGFEPSYGFLSRQNGYTLRLYNSHEFNGDDEWVEKEPEFLFQLTPRRLAKNSSWVSNFSFSDGKWSEDGVNGWRQEYRLYFQRDPIQLSKVFKFEVGTGFDRAVYGYNSTANNIWMLNLKLKATPNERLTTWVGYNYNNESGTTPYEYDRIDVSHELVNGITYKLDSKDAVMVETSYDTQNEYMKDVDYTWKRNLHCWEADLTYRAKRDQWRLKVSTVSW